MKKIILTLAFISTVSCIKVPVIERNPVINNPGNETSQNTEKDINLEFNSDKWWQSLRNCRFSTGK